ncbi:hypothetical protein [Jeotgalibacillus marinus]|uniref:Uncharacterized protein n=1 Tax=Jeotgalibacillus marinus TaxID=86667 RepID=A0ABV3Q7T2_9BACL
MRKEKSLIVRFMSIIVGLLLTVPFFTNSASAEGLGDPEITSKDFYIEDGKMKEIDDSLNISSLPPLEELLEYENMLLHTRGFPATEMADPVDHIAVVFHPTINLPMTMFYDLAQDADLFIINDGYLEFRWTNAEMKKHITDFPGGYIHPNIPLVEARYYKDNPLVSDTKVQFDGYWQRGDVVSHSNGNHIKRTYTFTSGIELTEAYSMTETLGIDINLTLGPPWAQVETSINRELSEAFSNAQTVTETQTVSTEYTFGVDGGNGIPYSAAVYQLMGDYKIVPGENLKKRLDDLETFPFVRFSLKPDTNGVANDYYRAVQVNDIEPDL